MAQTFFGGSGTGSSTTRSAYQITSGPIGLDSGRLAANGGTYAMMTSLAALVAGYTGTVSVNMTLGGGSCSFSVGNSGGLPGSYAGAGTNGWLFNGGSYNLVIQGSAQTRFNRGGGGNTTDSNGTTYGNTIGGYYTYVLPPTASTMTGVTPSTTVSGVVNGTFSGTGDNGGAGITNYRIYRDGVYILNNVTGSFSDSGLNPGQTYAYQVSSDNAVTAAAGTTSVLSNTITVVAPGVPTAATSLTATASSTVTGRVNLSWTAPATPGSGGITGYNIFVGGTPFASITGTTTTYAVNGLTPYTSYSFTVRARNAFADANSSTSPDSNSANATAPGPPGAPTGLTAVASGVTPGKISLAWTAPSTTGTGGITGYNIYFSTGTLVTSTTGTAVTYDVLGLNPGQTYSFYVTARNALADAEPSESAHSNTATAQALGEPPAPTGFAAAASAAVAGRISLSWVAGSGLTGYNVFERNVSTSVDTLIATVKSTFYYVDGLAGGTSHTYVLRARNSYTDTLATGYPGNYGGPATAAASATAGSDYSETVGSLSAVTDSTNTAFNGTYTINAITPTTVRYAKVATSVASVATSLGTVTDNTNAIFNGTYTVATPSATTFTYAKTASNIATATVTGGAITNNTNALFNGLKTVTAVNVGAKTVSYAAAGAVTSVAVPVNASPGQTNTISDTTNAVYNGTGLTITSIPSTTTLTYAKTNADLAQSNAAGTVTDITNQTQYNGTFVISGLPTYNTLTYTTTGANQAAVAVTSPGGDAYRNTSPGQLDIEYRSGWLG